MQPIYRSDGEPIAVVHRGHLYNIDGEWIGFLWGAEVFDVGGHYLGFLSEDRRLLCKRRPPAVSDRIAPAMQPRLVGVPEHFPLAPLFRQLPFDLIDVFEEYPERFKYVSEQRPDLD